MTSFWTLQKGYDGASLYDVDDLNPSRAYQFRHGDYFERISTPSVQGDKYMYTRMTDHPEVEEFLRDIQLVVPEDMIWNIVDKNYTVDAIADANIDSQLQSAYELIEHGVDPVEIENVRYRYEPGEDWTAVPKPWRSKDAYLIGKGDEYRITLAPHGETNNKIEKADVVYQLTANGLTKRMLPLLDTLLVLLNMDQRLRFPRSRRERFFKVRTCRMFSWTLLTSTLPTKRRVCHTKNS